MQFLIGALAGAGIAFLAMLLADRGSENTPVSEDNEAPQTQQNEALLRQWSNLLNYCGKEQHDED